MNTTTKSKNRFAAVFLALAMLLTLIPVSDFVTVRAGAAETVYILNADSITAGDYSNAADTKAGTDDFFTIKWGDKGKVDASHKDFDDGVTVENRINFGGKTDVSQATRVIEFKTEGAAKVKVWWVCGDAGRKMHVYSTANETDVAASEDGSTKNSLYISTFDVTEAGTYWLASTEGTNYIFRVEVTPQVAAKEYELDAGTITAGDYKDAADTNAGTDGYFTIKWGDKGKVDASSQKFDDGFAAEQRINFGGKTDVSKQTRVIQFKTEGAAKVKVWWVCGDADRKMHVYSPAKSADVAASEEGSIKNSQYINTFDVTEAGTYWLASTEGTNYIFKVVVTEGGSSAPVVRGDWNDVAAPVIDNITQNGGKIVVSVNADVGNDGGDKVVITMTDSEGNETSMQSLANAATHTREFSPTASGTYRFKAVLSREGEADKESSDSAFDFVLPLGKPTISAATNKGAGSVELEWTAVAEAEKYNIYNGTELAATSDTTKYTVTGLEVGKQYSFTVAAVRGDEEGGKSDERTITVSAESQSKWSSIFYGTSTGASKNYVVGDLNEDGKVQIVGNGGKIVPAENYDGVTFYYTEIPDSLNFTLKAKVHIDEIDCSDGQTGFGLLAIDSLPAKPNTTDINPSNQYMLAVSKMEYRWNDGKITYDSSVGEKYTMKHGIGVNERLLDDPEDTGNASKLHTQQYPLETSAAEKGLDAGTYNIIGADADYGNLTDFVFEIQRNNTGYFLTYYDTNGKTVIGRQKFYDPKALSVFDKDNVYVGLFAARKATVTFSDVSVTTIKPEDDAPAEARPITWIVPNVSITSASVTNSPEYTLMFTPNVKGTVTITVSGKTIVSDVPVNADELFTKDITISNGRSTIKVIFTPAPNDEQGFDEYTKITHTNPITNELTLKYNLNFANQNNLYVSPTGMPNGNGGRDYPLDIYTAVNVALPGQTIVIMEGTYRLEDTLRIERGMDGTADKPIRMIADPEATTRPVFDFASLGGGIRHGGNYWFFKGFDVTNSSDKSTGFRVCGSNNTLDQINTYNNGNTGVQISAFRDSNDPKELWPQNNLILNCTSYNNADIGYQDADGFAAKLTVGEGNVFDGCVAHNNADDGWDLFAKVATGEIGSVTIKNCVAYENGILLDGTIAGDGNGFKLGGTDLPGKHRLINSMSFNNKANGITSNSCPDVVVSGCTSYNNGINGNMGANLTLYSKNTNAIAFEVTDVIAYKSGKTDNIDGANSVKTNVHLNGEGITDDTFVSLSFNGVSRKADGTINIGDFLKVKDASLGGANFDKEGGSTSSSDDDPVIPDEDLPVPTPPTIPDFTVPTTPTDTTNPTTPDTTEEKKPVEFNDSNNDTGILASAPEDAFDNASEVKFNADSVVEETSDNTFTFELNFTDKDGNKIQPKVAVTVSLPVPAALKDKTIFVYHVEDDGKYTQIDCTIENGMIVFKASKFSKYIVTSEKLSGNSDSSEKPDSNSGADTNSGTDSGTSSDPGTQPNPATGAPIAGLPIVLACAAAICIIKRKRG